MNTGTGSKRHKPRQGSDVSRRGGATVWGGFRRQAGHARGVLEFRDSNWRKAPHARQPLLPERHSMAEPLLIAKSKEPQALLPKMANRHGLVAGATGTGKTVTLQVMAEAFSRVGVPVFAADVKGDLSGISQAGKDNPKIAERVKKMKLEGFEFEASPVAFWDVFGEQGHPVRTTVSEMGPLLFSRLLNLNDTQTGVLSLVFKIADDHQLLLLDLKDLQAMLQFLGEPALNIDDLMQTDSDGHGVVNILASDKLIRSPRVYATFLLWLLTEIFQKLPEVGDPDKPKLVFFFDE